MSQSRDQSSANIIEGPFLWIGVVMNLTHISTTSSSSLDLLSMSEMYRHIIVRASLNIWRYPPNQADLLDFSHSLVAPE